jgi:hypothetical protein
MWECLSVIHADIIIWNVDDPGLSGKMSTMHEFPSPYDLYLLRMLSLEFSPPLLRGLDN